MIFSLEILQAKFGDCLILHFGDNNNHHLMVIDGGPAGVYRNVLKPKLLGLKNKLSPASPLPLSMVMVSHMDDDHVNGILALTDDVIEREKDHSTPLFELKHLWFNTFDDIIGNIEIPEISSIAASASAATLNDVPEMVNAEHSIAAVIASTSQGRQLRANATALSAIVNDPFPKPNGKARLVRGDGSNSVVDWDGLRITVVHPNSQRLEEYQKKWDKDLEKAKADGDNSIISSILRPDTSPFNLSSIVCLIEFGGKKILLTGDSRAEDIIDGLELNGLIDADRRLHVDILKLPHHGSIRNATAEFYERIKADNYVISADGKHDNPDKLLLDLIAEKVESGTLFFTNKDGENGLRAKMETFEGELSDNRPALKIQYRDETKPSFVIHLGDPF